MRTYLIYLLAGCAVLTVNTGSYAQDEKRRNPFSLPVEIEKVIEKQKLPPEVPPAAPPEVTPSASPEPMEEIIKNLDDMANEAISKISLTGIVLLDGHRAAILDRKILREGDMINGWEIIGIEKNKVILLSNGRKYIIELRGEGR